MEANRRSRIQTLNHCQPITNCYLHKFKSIGSKDDKRNRKRNFKPTTDIKDIRNLKKQNNFSKNNISWMGEKLKKVTQNYRKLSRSQILDKLVNQEVEELLWPTTPSKVHLRFTKKTKKTQQKKNTSDSSENSHLLEQMMLLGVVSDQIFSELDGWHSDGQTDGWSGSQIVRWSNGQKIRWSDSQMVKGSDD